METYLYGHTCALVFISILGFHTYIERERSRLWLPSKSFAARARDSLKGAEEQLALRRSFCCKYRAYFQSLAQHKCRSYTWYKPQTLKIPFLTATPDHLTCLCTSFIPGKLLSCRMPIINIYYFDNQSFDCARNVSVPKFVETVDKVWMLISEQQGCLCER